MATDVGTAALLESFIHRYLKFWEVKTLRVNWEKGVVCTSPTMASFNSSRSPVTV